MADNKTNIDILINTAQSATNVRDLRKALKDLVSAQEQVDKTSPDFDKLIDGINETESRIGDLNDSFKTFAGTGMERLTSSTSLLRDGLNNLDLDKLKIGMEGLKQLPKALAGEFTKLAGVINKINFKSLGTSMKGLADSGVGALTKSIVQLGVAILTNPIMLLAAVIIGLVAVVVKFYDKIKPLRLAVEAFGAAIDIVVQSLKDFADWIGITDFAGEKAANNQVENAKKVEAATTRKYDQEIAMAEAAGQSTYEIEKKKLYTIQKSQGIQIAGIQKLMDINGDADGKYKQQLQELVIVMDDAYKKSQVLDVKHAKEKSDKEKEDYKDGKKRYEDYLKGRNALMKKFDLDISKLKIDNIKNDQEREEMTAKATYESSLNAYKEDKVFLELKGKDRITADKKLGEFRKQAQEKLDNDLAKIYTKYRDQELKDEISYVDESIELRKKLLKKPGEGKFISAKDIEADVELLKKKYFDELELQRTKEEESLKQSEKDEDKRAVILANGNVKRKILLQKFEDEAATIVKEYRDKDNEDLLAKREIAVMNAKKGSQQELEARKSALALKTSIELDNNELTTNQKLLIEKKYIEEVKKLEQEYSLSSMSLLQATLTEKQQKQLETIKQIAAGINAVISEVASLMAQQYAQEQAEFDKLQQDKVDSFRSANAQMEQDYSDNQAIQLANFTGTEDEKRALQTQMAQDKVRRDNENKMAEYDMAIEKYNFDLKIKKKAFETNKKMQIASAIISGALAVVNGLSMQPFIPLGIISAATAAITTGISVAKISSTQFQDTGSPPQKPTLANPAAAGLGGGSSTGSSGGGGNFSAPQFYKLGQGGANGGSGSAQRVYVLESDITKTQKGVQRVETRSTMSL